MFDKLLYICLIFISTSVYAQFSEGKWSLELSHSGMQTSSSNYFVKYNMNDKWTLRGSFIYSSSDSEHVGQSDDPRYYDYSIIAGVQYTIDRGDYQFYFGGDVGYSYYYRFSAIFPNRGMIFNRNDYYDVRLSSIEFSKIDFYNAVINAGLKYYLNRSIYIGAEAGLGIGSYDFILKYEAGAVDNFKGQLFSMSPMRFFYIGVDF